MAGEKKAKPVKLTTKQRKLVKGIVAGKTQKQAAIDAGYSPKHAESAASHEINKTQVKATLQEMMELHGLDDASILKVHADMIKATRGGEPDWTARSKGVEMAYKLKGAFVEKRELTGADGGPLKVEADIVLRPQVTREEWLEIHGMK